MNDLRLKQAAELAGKIGNIIVATSGITGMPHIAAAGRLIEMDQRHVILEAWFCPGTIENVEQNPKISLVIWDQSQDYGIQLLGEVEASEDFGVLDGYLPGMETTSPPPQVDRRLMIRVDKALHFSHAPHSDVEEQLVP